MAKATKKTGKKRSPGSKPPIGPNEYIAVDNESARKAIPKKLAVVTEKRRVSIHVPYKGFDIAKASRLSEETGALELELPEGAGVGVPGREYGRLPPTEIKRDIKSGVLSRSGAKAFRPDWVDYTPHAKVIEDTRPGMRRLNGSPIVPHYGVFGADDRMVYYPSGYPWICVGKLEVWSTWGTPSPQWTASAVLIGDRVILTAGHVAPWGSSSWGMRFTPAYYDGSSTLGSGVSSWVSDYYGYDTGNSVSAWDMLVCRLYTPLGSSYGYFGTKNYHSSWEDGNYWTLAGYPGAVAGGNRPSRQMWWPVLDDDSDGNAEEVEYEADATAGNSGGPVFGFWSGDPYAIATHSGGSKTTFLWWTIEDTNVGAGGAALNNLVAWARSNWP